jgi:hypothetical protein
LKRGPTENALLPAPLLDIPLPQERAADLSARRVAAGN